MIIEVDKYKKNIPGYDPKRSEDFHAKSGKLADKDFIEQLKTGKYEEVIFMAGGTASGKTEYSASYLDHEDQLVYDGTLKSSKGFRVKMDKVERYAKNNPSVKVVLIVPNYWRSALEVFLKRERKMGMVTFFDTHIRSKLVVAKILRETKIDVEIYVSRIAEDGSHLEYIPIILGKDRDQIARELVSIAEDLHSRGPEMEGLNLIIDYDNI